MTAFSAILLAALPAGAFGQNVVHCPKSSFRDSEQILSRQTTDSTLFSIAKGILEVRIDKMTVKTTRTYDAFCFGRKEEALHEIYRVVLKSNRVARELAADSRGLIKNKVLVNDRGLFWQETMTPLSLKETVTEVLIASKESGQLASLSRKHRGLIYMSAVEMANSLP